MNPGLVDWGNGHILAGNAILGAKSRTHLEENVRAADIVLTAEDLAEIDRIVPPGAAFGTRYPLGH